MASVATEDVESFPQGSESHDDTCMMQVPELTINQVTNSQRDTSLQTKTVRPPSNVELLYTGLQSKGTEPLFPVTVALAILGIVVAMYFLHNSILAAFQSLPFGSCILFLVLLAVLSWTIIPLLWGSAEVIIARCGCMVLVSCYIAMLVLMVTPLIMFMPNKAAKPQLIAHERKIAMLYLFIFSVVVASGISIFLVAELAGGAGKEKEVALVEVAIAGGLAGPLMITSLYAILSWSSLAILYERMFPHRSFADDFPALVFERAFNTRPMPPAGDSALQSRLEGMRSAIEAMPKYQQPSQQELKDFHGYMSTSLAGLNTDVVKPSIRITDDLRQVQATMDDTILGSFLHHFGFFLYVIAVLVGSLWLGVLLCSALLASLPFLLAFACVVVGCFALLLVVVTLMEIIVHDSNFGGFAAGVARPGTATRSAHKGASTVYAAAEGAGSVMARAGSTTYGAVGRAGSATYGAAATVGSSAYGAGSRIGSGLSNVATGAGSAAYQATAATGSAAYGAATRAASTVKGPEPGPDVSTTVVKETPAEKPAPVKEGFLQRAKTKVAHILHLDSDTPPAKTSTATGEQATTIGREAPPAQTGAAKGSIEEKADSANTLFKQGDFEGAEKQYREIWEARIRSLGPEHSDTLTMKENVANAMFWCGDVTNAEKLYREVLEVRMRTQGQDHPDTLSSKYRLERCLESSPTEYTSLQSPKGGSAPGYAGTISSLASRAGSGAYDATTGLGSAAYGAAAGAADATGSTISSLATGAASATYGGATYIGSTVYEVADDTGAVAAGSTITSLVGKTASGTYSVAKGAGSTAYGAAAGAGSAAYGAAAATGSAVSGAADTTGFSSGYSAARS